MKDPRSAGNGHLPDSADPLIPNDDDCAESRRALALLWLADSSPLTAAPSDSLTNIRAGLDLMPAPPQSG